MRLIMKALTAATLGSICAASASAGIGVEANGARADGHWGGEFGANYSWGIAGFNLTPGVGAFVYHHDGDEKVKPYGRVEATYHVPAFATVGAGVRISADHTRPYGTVALPILPTLAMKANAGPKYYAAGLTFGF